MHQESMNLQSFNQHACIRSTHQIQKKGKKEGKKLTVKETKPEMLLNKPKFPKLQSFL